MFSLLQIELYKIYKRPRTYIAFAAIAGIVLMFQFAFKADGQSYMNLMLQNVQDNFELDPSKAINGYFMCYIILNTLLVQVPILVALIAGELCLPAFQQFERALEHEVVLGLRLRHDLLERRQRLLAQQPKLRQPRTRAGSAERSGNPAADFADEARCPR